ncbi:host-nuclease inhibitor Gam family protein [Lactiplantibacillus plantarum]|uniref:host-nuclease inhibitor Gam family protein n=1 Tax=Lactiplantibacillus plantarum TaxID=1590 RepID=UPI001BA77C6C|nr:host-nuclease inhibitor Gam family protein [Lactiplantibacillus plantarum]MBS0953367.1 host-nuclease inhibitor Gam family protein [Lactiplantibacillus plantarum]
MMNELLKDELKTISQRESEGFKISTLQEADWAMRKLQAMSAQDDENKATAKANIDDINAWLERKLTENQASREYFKGLLQDYLYEQRKTDKKFKIDTPHGTVTTSKVPAGLKYQDAAVLKSLHDQGVNEFIRVKEEVNKVGLKKNGSIINGKFVLSDGEIIDGVTEKPATESVKYTF